MNEPILRFFEYGHLPVEQQAVVRPFALLANAMVFGGVENVSQGGNLRMPALPRNAERTASLRKLLEAMDAALRAHREA